MDLSSRHVPDEPCFDGTKKQIPGLSLCTGIGNVRQYPIEFRSAEIRIDQKTGLVAVFLRKTVFFQFLAETGRAPALPYDCIIDGFACVLIPDNCRFSLIGDTDGIDVGSRKFDLPEGFSGDFQLG